MNRAMSITTPTLPTLALFVPLALLLGCPESAVDPPPVEPSLPTAANHERLSAMIQELSADDMEGRLTGTPSGDRAEQYLLDKMQATGLQVHTHEVVFPMYEVGSPIDLAIVDEAGNSTSFTYLDSYREVDYSGSGSVTAEVIFAGYGLDTPALNDYDGLDVTGKVVMVFTGVPSGASLDANEVGRLDHKIHNAAVHGAAGLIFIPLGSLGGSVEASGPEAELRALESGFWLHPELLHDDLPVVFVHRDIREALLGRPIGEVFGDPTPFATGITVHLEVHGTTHVEATCRNVFGVLPGAPTSPVADEVVLLGAHYDHLGVDPFGRIFNGAGDNASGTGVVLEAATTIGQSGATPERTLVFALFCAEEQGLFGSLNFVMDEPLFPIANTALMMQVDSLEAGDGPYVTNLDDGEMVTAFLGDAAQHPEYPIPGIDWEGNCASDDCAFLWWDVPAYRFVSYGSNHHRATDDFENLDMALVGRVADVAVQGMVNVGW